MNNRIFYHHNRYIKDSHRGQDFAVTVTAGTVQRPVRFTLKDDEYITVRAHEEELEGVRCEICAMHRTGLCGASPRCSPDYVSVFDADTGRQFKFEKADVYPYHIAFKKIEEEARGNIIPTAQEF